MFCLPNRELTFSWLGSEGQAVINVVNDPTSSLSDVFVLILAHFCIHFIITVQVASVLPVASSKVWLCVLVVKQVAKLDMQHLYKQVFFGATFVQAGLYQKLVFAYP